MDALLLYRPNSPHERLALDYLRDFKMQTGKELPTMDIDSAEGAHLCEVYDIVQYPAIIVRDDNGAIITQWVGEPLPRISEVSYYVQSA